MKFEEVDAAGIAFFARFFNWCHEAMGASSTRSRKGGYVSLIMKRRVGFPTIPSRRRLEGAASLRRRGADRTSVVKVGTTSATFRYVLTRVSDGVMAATIEHDRRHRPRHDDEAGPPDDCRKLLEAHVIR